MGRKGCIMRYCKTQMLVGNNLQITLNFPLFSVSRKRRNEMKHSRNVNPYKNKVYPNIVMYIAALLKIK